MFFIRGYVIRTGGYASKVKLDVVEYLVPYQLGKFNSIAWTVLFAPFLEEILFFAIPSMFGFWYTVTGLVTWASVHIGRIAYGLRFMTSTVDRIGATISYAMFISLHGWLSLWLWSIGFGLLSIVLHSLHNALCVLTIVFAKRFEKRKYWVKYKIF
ncbi:MAG: hypothetical protein DRO40_11115 [Thermoprotei archaeon]|nr:MAG: hypothetical protein DRO40_11115 [Thermoprotei archaeon]